MLWIYNNKLNQNGLCEFYQIFTKYNLVYSDEGQNNIYSFDSVNLDNLKFELSDYKYENIKCEIKIMEHVISYNILNEHLNENLNKRHSVFTFKTNLIEPKNNQYNIPIFNNIYKSTNTKRLPNLIETEYDFSSILDFKIYKLDPNNNTQFVVESNPITNSTRNYFITTDLNLVKQFL